MAFDPESKQAEQQAAQIFSDNAEVNFGTELKTVRTIDVTPTWLGILPAMLMVWSNNEAPLEARKNIEHEFKRMAGLADAHVESIKQGRDMAAQLEQAVVELGMSDPEADVEAITRIEGVVERLR